MIKIYGIVASRALRNLWMLEELGVPYEHVKVNQNTGGTRTPEYLALNPNGHVPTLQDGELTLFESMAINLYLARKYGKAPLWPESLEDQARATQWSFWVMLELEAALLTCMRHRALLPEDKRDSALADQSDKQTQAPLAVLAQFLAKSPYLLGDAFSVADLNVAAVLMWTRRAQIDLSAYPNVDAWLTRCLDREARKAAAAKN